MTASSASDLDLPILQRYRYTVLLGGLTLLLIMSPLVHALGPRAELLTSVLLRAAFVAMLVTALLAIATSARARLRALLILAPGMVVQFLGLVWISPTTAIVEPLLEIVVVGYVVVSLLCHLFTSRRVTIDTIAESLCAYLLLGLTWAMVYSLLDAFDPGSFNLAFVDTEGGANLRFHGRDSVIAIYYSFVTLTTLGFGDITPATSLARTATAIEAVVGQLFLTVLVARLVGMHIAQETSSER